MKYVCNKCEERDGSSPCILTFEGAAGDDPSWCPYALDPFSEDSYPDWKEVESSKLVTITPSQHDTVNSPSHYCKGGFELAPILYVWGLSHRRASAVEYIMRAGDKATTDEIEDLRKAIRNIEMEIEYMEKYGKNRGEMK